MLDFPLGKLIIKKININIRVGSIDVKEEEGQNNDAEGEANSLIAANSQKLTIGNNTSTSGIN